MNSPNAHATMTTTRDIVASSTLPQSFQGDEVLFGLNLFMHTGFMLLGLMMAGWMVASIVGHRKTDKWPEPAFIYRCILACASSALMLRSGGEAASLWAWNPAQAQAAASVLRYTRMIDPIALCFAGAWLALAALSYPSMIAQLRKSPYPVQMLARAPDMKRPLYVVGMTFVAASLIAYLK